MDATPLKVRIVEKRPEAVDIVTLVLEPLAGEQQLPSFSAGSHVDVEIRPGLVRQYSLCNDSEETHRYVIGALKDPGSRGGSVAVHEELAVGQEIRISHPRNHFSLAHNASRSLLFAGGIGVTPILCMTERLALTDADFSMHYCARSRDRMAFLKHIQSAPYADKVSLHFDDEDESQKLDLKRVLASESHDSHIYVCGPSGFMNFIIDTVRELGWPEDHVHYEFFVPADVDTSGDEVFEIQVASSGKVYQVGVDDTIVSVLADDDVEIMTSCEQGICGSCITRVLDGTPEHRDQVLTDQEREEESWITPCCSRSKTKRLVLDL